MVDRDKALRGRAVRMLVADRHAIHGTPLDADFEGMEMALFGMGCFWGAEKGFWLLPGVHSTSVGYAGGYTPNASYEEVCSGQTGHNEVVRVVFDPRVTSYDAMLKQFWEGHDPTQGMRQGADVGTQYRSAIYYYSDAQRRAAERSRDEYQKRLTAAGYGPITTESRQSQTTISPRTTISNISQKIHAGTAAMAEPGWHVRRRHGHCLSDSRRFTEN